MVRRYEKVRYVDTETGEVLIGESAYRRYLEANGISRFSRRGERRTTFKVVDGVEYVSVEQEFRIMGIMERLKLEDQNNIKNQ